MINHRLGEFRRTKETGSRIHLNNRLAVRLGKKMRKLRMEAMQRKRDKKKKSKSQIRKEKNREKSFEARNRRSIQEVKEELRLKYKHKVK